MHDALETQFAGALLDPRATIPAGVIAPGKADPARRFAVYRNNVVVGLINALESRFPVVLRLVGREFFRAMASLYVTEDPPRSPIMFRYGSTFPAFIESFRPAATVPFLADVARLELARGVAYHAADAVPLRPEAFKEFGPDALMSTGLRLHPSVTLVTSRYPVVSIWEAHQGDGEPQVADWEPEAALVARPDLDVEVRRLPPGGFAFLTALSQGASIARAAAIAAAEAPGFDPVRNFELLVDARIGVRLAAARVC